MNLGELKDELRHGILRDKSDQVAGAHSDELWSDANLITYIAKAQEKFAQLTLCLRDSTTPEVCLLPIIAGRNTFSLHPAVIAVITARYPGDTADLARAGHEVFNSYRAPDRLYFDLNSPGALTPGKPRAFSTDDGMAEDQRGSFNAMEFRVYPDVGVGYGATLALRVIRMPLRHLSLDDLNARLEIPPQYHMDILDYAGYLALRGPDLDVAGGEGYARAMSLRGSFMSTVEDCKRDMRRRMFAPMTFGFGRNGFHWERD